HVGLKGLSRCASISTRTMRARLTSNVLKSRRRTMWNSSLSAPATSTPVGPPPTTTNVTAPLSTRGARAPPADDHERQRAPVDEGRVGVDGLEPLQHVVPEADGVSQVVEGEAVL